MTEPAARDTDHQCAPAHAPVVGTGTLAAACRAFASVAAATWLAAGLLLRAPWPGPVVSVGGALVVSALCAWGYVAVARAVRRELREPAARLADAALAAARDVKARPDVGDPGDLAALAGALARLAEARRAELSRVAEQRDRMRAVLDVMAEGVLLVRPDGTILHANRALRQMFAGRKRVLVAGSGQQMQIPDMRALIALSVRTKQTRVGELTVTGGPRTRSVMVRATPLDDELTGMVCVLSDVTDLRHLERVRRDFVANVSHELRTPIAAVRAAVETLQGGAVSNPEVAPKFLAAIERQTLRVHRLVEDLLELSRIEAHELKISLGRVDVGAAARDTLEGLRPSAHKRGVTLECVISPGAEFARADGAALEHVLTNLIDNAIKYSRPGATVRVAAAAREGGVRVSVEDNGPGIEAHHLPRLFERFYRVDPGRSRELGGTGLGLAIVKHLTEAMHGTVSVESEVGRGSAFHVDLPAV